MPFYCRAPFCKALAGWVIQEVAKLCRRREEASERALRGKKLGNKRAWARKQSICRLQSGFFSCLTWSHVVLLLVCAPLSCYVAIFQLQQRLGTKMQSSGINLRQTLTNGNPYNRANIKQSCCQSHISEIKRKVLFHSISHPTARESHLQCLE